MSYLFRLIVGEHLRVDPVELQNKSVYYLCVQTPIRLQEPAVCSQLFQEGFCQRSHAINQAIGLPQCHQLGLMFITINVHHNLAVSTRA